MVLTDRTGKRFIQNMNTVDSIVPLNSGHTEIITMSGRHIEVIEEISHIEVRIQKVLLHVD
jgi:hypothetical protein